MTQTASTGIAGLDLMLGGGLRLVNRGSQAESAVVAIRGPAGAGKTILAAHIARAIAARSNRVVAYACLELLPRELAAQFDSFSSSLGGARVVAPPFDPFGADSHGALVTFYASIVETGEAGLEDEFQRAVERLREQVKTNTGHVPVMVIDSLSDGYHLGAAAPRAFVDAVCKFAAANGLVLVLVEEGLPGSESRWSYAADTVIELDHRATGLLPDVLRESQHRTLAVTKHRFGPAASGRGISRMSSQEGLEVYPDPSLYSEAWAAELLPIPPRPTAELDWSIRRTLHQLWPEFSRSVTVVTGAPNHVVKSIAARLVDPGRGRSPHGGVTLWLEFGRNEESVPTSDWGLWIHGFGDPYITPHAFLAVALDRLSDVERRYRLACVVVHDVRAIRSYANAGGLRRAVAILVQQLRRRTVPVIVTDPSLDHRDDSRAAPLIADFADVVLTVSDAERLTGTMASKFFGAATWSLEATVEQPA